MKLDISTESFLEMVGCLLGFPGSTIRRFLIGAFCVQLVRTGYINNNGDATGLVLVARGHQRKVPTAEFDSHFLCGLIQPELRQ